MLGKSDLLGKPALPFSVTDINGNNYSLESLKGKVVVINFWFVECKLYIMEMPELNKIVEKYKNKDVVGTYGETSFPMHIVIDENSIVTFAVNGFGSSTIEELENAIDSSVK